MIDRDEQTANVQAYIDTLRRERDLATAEATKLRNALCQIYNALVRGSLKEIDLQRLQRITGHALYGTSPTERVRFLNDSGVEHEADVHVTVLRVLRAGYPMKGWPHPWREVAAS